MLIIFQSHKHCEETAVLSDRVWCSQQIFLWVLAVPGMKYTIQNSPHPLCLSPRDASLPSFSFSYSLSPSPSFLVYDVPVHSPPDPFTNLISFLHQPWVSPTATMLLLLSSSGTLIARLHGCSCWSSGCKRTQGNYTLDIWGNMLILFVLDQSVHFENHHPGPWLRYSCIASLCVL